MRSSAHAAFAALALAWATVACGPSGVRIPLASATGSADAEGALHDARAALDAGELDRARTHFAAIMTSFPADPAAADARLGLAQIALLRNAPREALEHLVTLPRSASPTMAGRFAIHRAVALEILGEHEAALAEIEPHVGLGFEDVDLIHRTRARAAIALQNLPIAFDAFEHLFAIASEDERNDLRAQAKALVDSASPEELTRIEPTLRERPLSWAVVAERVVVIAFQRGELARVRDLGNALRRARVPVSDDTAALVLRASHAGSIDPNAIGVVLSRADSSRMRAEYTDAFLLGSRAAGLEAPDGLRIVLRTTEEDGESVRTVCEELIRAHSVIAVISMLPNEAGSVLLGCTRTHEVPAIARAAPETPDALVVAPMAAETVFLAHFAARFRETYSREPSPGAHDAALALERLRRAMADTPTTREQLRNALQRAVSASEATR